MTKNDQNALTISGYSYDLLTKLSTQLNFKFVVREVKNITGLIDEVINEVLFRCLSYNK